MGKYFNRIVIVLAMLVVVSTLGAVSAGAQESNVDFSIPINVSKTTGISQSAAMTLDPDGRIYIAWEERSLELPLFSRSMDGGTTFTEPVALAPSIENFSYGQLSMSSSHPGELQTAFTVFETYYGWADIVYTSSSDGGATFSEPVFISDFDFVGSVAPDIATGWSTAIAWFDFDVETGETAIRYIQSLDGGGTFTSPRRLDGAQGQVSCVDVALWGEGSAYAAWSQNELPYGDEDAWEIFFTRSTDRGETFSTPVNISNYPHKSWCPRMAVDGSGTIYLVWAEGNYVTDIKLMFTKSVNGGISFEEPRALVGPLPSLEPEMSLAASGDGNLWISWMTGDPLVHLDGFFIRSIDGGATFSPAVPLPGAGAKITSIGPNVVHIVWNEVPQGGSWSEIFYSRGVGGPMVAALPPTSLTVPVADADGTYAVSWSKSATNGVLYVLEEATDSNFTNSHTVYSGTELNAIISRRSSGVTYYYRVKATLADYTDSAWVNGGNGCVVMIPAGAPGTLTVPASDVDGVYTVSWTTSNTIGISYVLEEATNSDFTAGLRTAYSGIALNAVISGRTIGVTYYYRVKATLSGYTDSVWVNGGNGCFVTPKVMVGTKPFSTLQFAYDDAATTTGSIIKLLEGTFVNSLTASKSISVKLEGGYNATYDAVSTETTIQGPLKVRSGTVRMKGVKVR